MMVSALGALYWSLVNWDPLWVAFGVLLTALLYYVTWWPLNRVKDLSHTGFAHLARHDLFGRSKKEIANEIRRLRKQGDVPPVYPNGWFALLESNHLKRTQVRPIHALGESFVVFRGEEGVAHVLDAYCPHLGANLGLGGRVVGDCIECPFHGWQFKGDDGQCVKIPYAKKVPDFAKVKVWPVTEKNGFIFVWYHCDGIEPEWQVPVIDNIQNGTWKYKGRTDYKVSAHIQEIPENAADVAHLGHLHAPSMFLGSNLFTTSTLGAGEVTSELKDHRGLVEEPRPFQFNSFLRHYWAATWAPEPAPESHVGTMHVKHDFRLFNSISFIEMSVEAKQIGPGLVHLVMDSKWGRGVFIQTVTPVEPLVQRIIHQFYASSAFLMPLAKIALLGEAIMFERDVMVWNAKTYLSRPLLVAEDKTIAKHRRWYSQFYTADSPKLKFQNDSLDW